MAGSITNHQIIANTVSYHFTTFPTKISQKISPNNYSTTSSDNNHNAISFTLNHVCQNSFPNIKHWSTSTKEIENIIQTLKLPNSCGYDEVPSKLLKLCSYYIKLPAKLHMQ